MKTNSTLFRPTGVLLALLLLFALASPNALAVCGQCDDVVYELYYVGVDDVGLELVCENPTGASIFYTVTYNTPNTHDPQRCGSGTCQNDIYTHVVPSGTVVTIPSGSTGYFRAFAWKSCWYDSVNITTAEQHNPNE